MLNVEESLYHIRRAKQGDNKSKEVLLENNTLLIKSLIKRFLQRGVDYDDLYQIACIGFLKAIKNFDESFNVKFSTYAVPMIIGEVKRFLRDDGAIKVSRIIKMQATKINRYIEGRRDIDGKSPTIDEIAEALNMTREEIVFALDSNKMPISIYEEVGDGNEKRMELIDKLPAKEGEDDMIEKILLKQLIESLPERQRKIIIMRYYRDNTQSEIAKSLGISQVQISRLENKIIQLLKSKI